MIKKAFACLRLRLNTEPPPPPKKKKGRYKKGEIVILLWKALTF